MRELLTLSNCMDSKAELQCLEASLPESPYNLNSPRKMASYPGYGMYEEWEEGTLNRANFN